MTINYKPKPISYGTKDIVLNPYGVISIIEDIRCFPECYMEGKPIMRVRVKENTNSWCVYDMHKLKGVLEAFTEEDFKILISRIGEKYE